MSEIPPENAADLQELITLLRRKEQNWVEWGKACAVLQKAGYTPQQIFEETGFEAVQQNQVIVGYQVYDSVMQGDISEATQSFFQRKGSDILYQFRILTQPQRVQAAEFAVERQLDADDAKDLTKALKEFSRVSRLPEGFVNHAGDAIAYQCWRLARQNNDLQQRSRLIAKGLQYAHSATARQQLEQLLTDFTVFSERSAPRFPLYRLESEEELPRTLPVVGELPLTVAELKAVPLTEEIAPFRLVKFSGQGAWVAVPGWQVIVKAEDPVVIFSHSDQLPAPLPGKIEEILIVIDRAQRQWNVDSYFLVEQENQLKLQWFDTAPSQALLGQVILIMRPKKILDENHMHDLWQIE
ncbi:MAG: RuBisCO accumulation factor 1 [Microcoleaceae cyanobacterium]